MDWTGFLVVCFKLKINVNANKSRDYPITLSLLQRFSSGLVFKPWSCSLKQDRKSLAMTAYFTGYLTEYL